MNQAQDGRENISRKLDEFTDAGRKQIGHFRWNHSVAICKHDGKVSSYFFVYININKRAFSWLRRQFLPDRETKMIRCQRLLKSRGRNKDCKISKSNNSNFQGGGGGGGENSRQKWGKTSRFMTFAVGKKRDEFEFFEAQRND